MSLMKWDDFQRLSGQDGSAAVIEADDAGAKNIEQRAQLGAAIGNLAGNYSATRFWPGSLGGGVQCGAPVLFERGRHLRAPHQMHSAHHSKPADGCEEGDKDEGAVHAATALARGRRSSETRYSTQ